MEAEELDEFVAILLTNGFIEGKKGSFSNGEVMFVVYGLGPYKVNVRRKLERKSITGERVKKMAPSSLERVIDMIPDPVREFIFYTMDSFHSEHIGFVVKEKIGIGMINPRGLSSLDIVYK